MSFLIVSTALRASSKTSLVAEAMLSAVVSLPAQASLLDLATFPLPLCDGGSCFQDPGVRSAAPKVQAARLIILCCPVYNHQANAAAKNFVEVTNDGWKGKVVGLVANGGTDRSYLAPLSIANSLMVDHRCNVVPRFVFVTPPNFSPDGTLPPDGEVASRLTDLASELMHLAPHWPMELQPA